MWSQCPNSEKITRQFSCSSQLQRMQEQMNSMSDSGDFQDAESNSSERLSHVSSQPVMVPSTGEAVPRAEKFGDLTTAPRDCPQRIESDDVQRNREALKPEGRRLFTQVKTDKIQAQFQCRHVQQNR